MELFFPGSTEEMLLGRGGRAYGHSRRTEVQNRVNAIPVFKRRVDLWKAP